MTSWMSPKDLETQYNLIADKYEQIRSSSTIGLNYLDRFVSLLPANPTVLDIGCGPAVPLTKQLVANGAKVVAIDISESMIKKAEINVPEASCMKADVTEWDANQRFDGIFAWDSLFHIPLDKQLPVLQKILTWLHPEGVAMITVGGQRGEIVYDMFGRDFYYSALSNTEYKDIVRKAGCRLLFDEMDDPSSYGHRVICCKKTV